MGREHGAGRELSLAGYVALLAEFREAGYSFRSFGEALGSSAPEGPCVVLRHDVDNHPALAVPMAEAEARKGIASTYFFLLRTEFYNVFSPEGSRSIRRILSLGHHLGLHFDASTYPQESTTDDLAAACRREAALLGGWFGSELDAVSFHRPDPRVLAAGPELSAPLPHTYMREFTGEMVYLSDSRGRFREGWPTDHEAFRRHRPIQLLIHPLWWGEEARPPLQTLGRFLDFEHRLLDGALEANSAVFRDRPRPDAPDDGSGR